MIFMCRRYINTMLVKPSYKIDMCNILRKLSKLSELEIVFPIWMIIWSELDLLLSPLVRFNHCLDITPTLPTREHNRRSIGCNVDENYNFVMTCQEVSNSQYLIFDLDEWKKLRVKWFYECNVCLLLFCTKMVLKFQWLGKN